MTRTPARNIALSAALTTALALLAGSAQASFITDPAGDFIPTFTGTHSGDLDVLSISATFDGSAFHLTAAMNGAIGTLPTALYVIGFNRGAAVANFAAIGLPGVVFDSVITMTGTGVLGGRDLVTGTAIVLPAGSAHISGSVFAIDILASLLPTHGLAFQDYGINLWPRDRAVAGNAQIADFAPDATDFTVVPEPATGKLALVGLAVLGWARQRGQRR